MARNKSIRYGDYIQAMSVDSHKIPYIELMPEPLFDRHGNEYPQPVPKIKMGGGGKIGDPKATVLQLNQIWIT